MWSDISIIVPTLNEEGNIEELAKRIDHALRRDKINYEIIIVDDNSSDCTGLIARCLAETYPVHFCKKEGKKGKAYSLLEGFSRARYGLTAMIDADLQYPPEAIPEMIRKIGSGNDIVVANRSENHAGFIRKISGKTFAFLFGKILHNLDCDVQSGLKVFKSKILKEVSLSPTPWTFDLEFLVNARDAGYKITAVDIAFDERHFGISKIDFLKAVFEIGINALALRVRRRKPFPIHPENQESMIGAGLAHKRKRYITHTVLEPHISAIQTLTPFQKMTLTAVFAILAAALFFDPLGAAIFFMAALSVIYFLDALFNLFIVAQSLRRPPEINFSPEELASINEEILPVYSILCPLYKEAEVLPDFLSAISKLDWPKDKLDVILLLEENDKETIDKANSSDLPQFIRPIIIPHSQPKTKPKACNYGLNIARGEFLVIYDAEDIPDPDQLKKAYLGFQKSASNIKCLQAKLNYHNPHQNLLTRLFSAEYSLWFDLVLPGLQSIDTSIPLGGTSNHFRIKDLRELRGWDPFNVTEDCDLGVRLFKKGFNTAIIDSTTLEEANSDLMNWLRQRSRWIKGYIQTYLVHMRRPLKFLKENGIHAFVFQLNVGGKIAFTLINPILWLTTISYFALYAIVGPSIEALYPVPIFYIAVFSLVFGNFLFLYYYMIGCAKRGHWAIIKYVFFIPVYWFFTSIAALIALYQLLVKPHFWEKTRHGLHLKKADKTAAEKMNAPEKNIPTRRFKLWPQGLASRLAFPKNFSSGAGFFIAAMMVSNFLNFLFNTFLGRTLSFEDLGLVVLINTVWTVISIFTGALSATVNRETAHLAAAKGKEASALFLRSVLKKSIIVGSFISLIWVLASPEISAFFNIGDERVLLNFSPVVIGGIIVAASGGFLNGNLHFAFAALVVLAESISKFALAAVFVSNRLESFVYLSIPLSIVLAALASIIFIVKKSGAENRTVRHNFPFRFYAAALMTGMSATLFLTLDIILAKHFLAPLEAGQYILLSLAGKTIYFLGSLPNAFMITYVSRALGLNRDPKKSFRIIFGACFILSCVGLAAFGPFGRITAPLLFGNKALAILPHLNKYSLAIFFFTLSNSFVAYHLAKKQYVFPAVSMVFSIAMALAILFYHGSVGVFTDILFASGAALSAVLTLLHFAENHLKFIVRAMIDFRDAFFSISKNLPPLAANKKILIFNWRDTRHDFAGGAETYIHELAKRWVKKGAYVTVFCGNDGYNPRHEFIDGVEIIRRGGFYFVYVWAFAYYILQFRGKYDLIIDCQNGIPFFTPLYAKEPVYCLIHHVHQEVFCRSLVWPLAALARFLEKGLMPLIYKKIKFITVSQSSKDAILKLGLGRAGVEIVHPGVDLAKFAVGEKNQPPLILYLGRLKAYKSIDVLIRAFKEVVKKAGEAKLVIAGSGEEEPILKKLVGDLGLESRVEFAGHVSEREKVSLFQKAWVLVNPSFIEGWGITTIEANACGTPVVAADVPGLRDSVRNPHTGFLVPYGNSGAFAEKILVLIEDHKLRKEFGQDAEFWAKNFSWDSLSERFLSIIDI